MSVVQYSYDSKNRLECTAPRMNPAIWGGAAATSACTAATTSTTYGPDPHRSRNTYDSLGRVTKVESAVGNGRSGR